MRVEIAADAFSGAEALHDLLALLHSCAEGRQREFGERRLPGGRVVDPAEELARLGSNAYRHVMQQRVPITSHPANRLIFPTAPGTSIRSALLTLPSTEEHDILTSHGIPVTALDRLRSGEGAGFVTERATFLAGRERDFMAAIGIESSAEPSGEADIDTW